MKISTKIPYDYRLEQSRETSPEAQEAIRNLVLMVTSLCTCGYLELRPSQASTGSLFQLAGFTLPQPSGRGTSVRNIQAFQVLQSVFLKSNSSILCGTIQDNISSIYHSDKANYFILENQNTLSQFIERIHNKPPEIQRKILELLEFVVFQLNFVPCKELISLSIFLKTHNFKEVQCSYMCLQSLLNILKHNVIFKDVYREVGMLEVLVTCLHCYADKIGENKELKQSEIQLGTLVMDALTLLLAGNLNNANVFRESGGAKCAHVLVSHVDCRQMALGK